MATDKLSAGDPVLLIWDDADYDSSAQVEVGHEKTAETTPMFTMGWFGRRTRAHVTLWTDRYKVDGDWQLRGRLTVRRQDVKRLERIILPDL